MKTSERRCGVFIVNFENIQQSTQHTDLFFNWDSLLTRLKSHYEAWSYKKKKYTKTKAHRKSV